MVSKSIAAAMLISTIAASPPYKSGELKTYKKYLYGRFTVVMQPS